MKKFFALAGLLGTLMFAAPAMAAPAGMKLTAKAEPNPAGTGHQASLAWTLSTDDTTANCTASANCAQTVYRAQGACSTSTSFAAIASPGATTNAYADTTLVPGSWCYAVTFTMNGAESNKATVTVALQPADVTGLGATVQ